MKSLTIYLRTLALITIAMVSLTSCGNDFNDMMKEKGDGTETPTPPPPPPPPPPPAIVTVSDLNLTSKITAPITGVMPITDINATEYNGIVDWNVTGSSSHSGNFLGSTAYTATVTLTANSGYTFTGVAADSFTHTSAPDTNVTNSADSGIVTIVFPATGVAVMTSIGVKTQPTRTAYGLNSSDDLNLTGLELTLTYNDGSEQNITYAPADDASYSIGSFSRATETAGSNTAPVTVTYGGKTANINLQVKKIVAYRTTGTAGYYGYDTLTDAIPSSSGEQGQTSTIALYADQTPSAQIALNSANTNITLTGNSAVNITGNNGGVSYSLVSITNGAKLTLGKTVGDDNITIKDHNNTGSGNWGIRVACGGAVYIAGSGSVFIMNGGEISGNTAVGNKDGGANGGGVCVYETNSQFIMNGGTIKNNTAFNDNTGGGGSAKYNGTGGGVYVYGSNSKFIMNGGEISSNKTDNSGGGVTVTTNATFTYNSGTISGNVAPTRASQVYKTSYSTVDGSGGKSSAYTDGSKEWNDAW